MRSHTRWLAAPRRRLPARRRPPTCAGAAVADARADGTHLVRRPRALARAALGLGGAFALGARRIRRAWVAVATARARGGHARARGSATVVVIWRRSRMRAAARALVLKLVVVLVEAVERVVVVVLGRTAHIRAHPPHVRGRVRAAPRLASGGAQRRRAMGRGTGGATRAPTSRRARACRSRMARHRATPTCARAARRQGGTRR